MWPLCGVREVHREECRQTLNRSTTTTPDIRRQPLLIFDDNHSRYSGNAFTYMAYMYKTWSFISPIWNRLMAVSDILQLAFRLCFQGGLFRTEHIKYYEKNVDKLWNWSTTTMTDISTQLDPSMLEVVFSFLRCGIICLGCSTIGFCMESPLCLLGRVFHIINIT